MKNRRIIGMILVLCLAMITVIPARAESSEKKALDEQKSCLAQIIEYVEQTPTDQMVEDALQFFSEPDWQEKLKAFCDRFLQETLEVYLETVERELERLWEEAVEGLERIMEDLDIGAMIENATQMLESTLDELGVQAAVEAAVQWFVQSIGG